jgi:hypothetical protein
VNKVEMNIFSKSKGVIFLAETDGSKLPNLPTQSVLLQNIKFLREGGRVGGTRKRMDFLKFVAPVELGAVSAHAAMTSCCDSFNALFGSVTKEIKPDVLT